MSDVLQRVPVASSDVGQVEMADAPALRTQLIDRNEFASLTPHWQRLADRCIEDNVYYSPHYALSLVETVARRVNMRMLTVWTGNTLVALLPVTTAAFSVPGMIPVGQGWQTLFTFNCTPLIDRHQPVLAASALIEGLAGLRRGEWVIPLLNVDGAAFGALTEALKRRGVPWLILSEFQRASLARGPSFESHMHEHLSSKRRRELARNRRRLAELGRVSIETHLSGPGLASAVEAFLKLEAGGWKGRRGTALSCRDDTRQFALKAFNSDDSKACRADVLLLNGTPIAAGIIVFAGKTGFTVKNAYDETYAAYGAGLLLEVEVLKSFLAEHWAERLDSATSGRHVIDTLWPGRMRVGDLAFSFSSPAPGLRLSAYARSRLAVSKAKTAVKRLLNR